MNPGDETTTKQARWCLVLVYVVEAPKSWTPFRGTAKGKGSWSPREGRLATGAHSETAEGVLELHQE